MGKSGKLCYNLFVTETHKKWLLENVPNARRDSIAAEIAQCRADLFEMIKGEVRTRNFSRLLEQNNWNAEDYFRLLLKKGRKLRILDAGSGWLEFSRDLKEAFEDDVFVTALAPVRPPFDKNGEITEAGKAKLAADSKKAAGPPEFYDGDGFEQEVARRLRENTEQLERIRESYNMVDEYRVGMAEDYSSEEPHDVIIDLFSPLHYSRFRERVLEVYFEQTTDDGRVVVGMSNTDEIVTRKLVESQFGRQSQRAVDTGLYFELTKLADDTFELQKKSA